MLPAIRTRRSVLDSPFDLLRQFDRAINDWDDNVMGAYPVDIREDHDALYVDAELPGFTKDQVDVSVENGVLTITAQRNADEKKTEQGQMHLHERRFTRVSRSFSLPNTVDTGKVDARLEHGVLHLKLTKRDEVKPRKITVS
jgi:HSP20 family protein